MEKERIKNWQIIMVTMMYLLINVIQAYFTELHYDEAYYWWYGQHLDWGFLDHPPMVAALTTLFQGFGKNELLLRLGTLLVSTGFVLLYLFWIKRCQFNQYIAILLLFSMPLVHTHIAGFMALPDVPLMFFVLAFFVVYQYFSEKKTYGLSVLLGCIAAAMIYSKYHAFLVLGFIVLSNLKLLKSEFFWLAVVVAIMFLIPHFLWQYEHDFPTLAYHLVSRTRPLTYKYLGEHLLNIFIIVGPLTFFFYVRALYMRRYETDFERGLMYVSFGFFLFFLISSLKLRTQVQWLIPSVPGVIYFTLKGINLETKRIQKLFLNCCWISISILLVGRIYIGSNSIPSIGKTKDAFYNNHASTDFLLEMAKKDGRKVVFYNSYSFASVHGFYSDEPAVMLHYPGYRINQFHYELDQELIRGEDILALHFIPGLPEDEYVDYGKYKKAVIEQIDNFYPIENLLVVVQDVVSKNDSLEFVAQVHNSYNFEINLDDESNIQFGVYTQADLFSYHAQTLSTLLNRHTLKAGEKVTVRYSVPKSVVKEKQVYVFVLNHGHSVGGFQWISLDRFNIGE